MPSRLALAAGPRAAKAAPGGDKPKTVMELSQEGDLDALERMMEAMDMAARTQKARTDQDRLAKKLDTCLSRSRSTGYMSGASQPGSPAGLSSPGRTSLADDTYAARGWMRPPKALIKGSASSVCMSIDRVQRYREETKMSDPTLRSLLRVDDGIDPRMQTENQGDCQASFRLDLNEPMITSEATRSACREKVLACLPEELQEHIGQCVPLQRGRAMQVRLLRDDAMVQIAGPLGDSLGTVTRQRLRNVNREAAFTAMMFEVGKIDPNRGPPPAEMDFEAAMVAQQEARETKEQDKTEKKKRKKHRKGRRKRGDGDSSPGSPGSPDSGGGVWSNESEESSDDEDPEQAREKLESAIALWDAKLEESSCFQEAAFLRGAQRQPASGEWRAANMDPRLRL